MKFEEANEILRNGYLDTDCTYEEINDAEKSFGIERYSDCLCNRCERKKVCTIGSDKTSNWIDEVLHNSIICCEHFVSTNP